MSPDSVTFAKAAPRQAAPTKATPPKSTPKPLLSLLTSTGSLTARLERLAGQSLKVVVLAEGYRVLSQTERAQLQLSPADQRLAWVRTVALYGTSDAPWAQATSIFPMASLTGDAKRLKALKNTPIGYVLFKRQRRLPHQRQYAPVDGHDARQTLYDWRGRKLLISEQFLPAILQRLEQDLRADA